MGHRCWWAVSAALTQDPLRGREHLLGASPPAKRVRCVGDDRPGRTGGGVMGAIEGHSGVAPDQIHGGAGLRQHCRQLLSPCE